MSASTIPAPGEAQPLSAFERIVDTFIAPSKTFRDLNRDPSWWVAWLLTSVFAVLFVVAVGQKVGFDQVAKNMVAQSPKMAERFDKLNPEARDQQLSIMAKSTSYTSYAWPVMSLIFAAVTAGVLMGTFNFGLGAEIPFSKAMAVVMYAWLPGILKSVLVALTLFAGADPEGFSLRNPLASNPGYFINATEHPVLHTLLSAVDVFAIWMSVLMIIGFACVSKLKIKTTATVLIGWYVVITLIGVGWMAVMG